MISMSTRSPFIPELPCGALLGSLCFLVLIFIFAMHYPAISAGGFGLSLPFNLLTWTMAAFFIAFGVWWVSGRDSIEMAPVIWVALLACVLMTIPVFFEGSVFSGVYLRLAGLWFGFLTFFLLLQISTELGSLRVVLWLVLAGALIQAAYGLFQYFFIGAGNNLGYDYINNRPYGVFYQPNVMASLLVTGLLVSTFLLASVRDRCRFATYRLWVLLGSVFIFAMLIMLLGSRSGWLSLLVGVVLLAPFVVNSLRFRDFVLWALSVLSGLLIGSWLLFNDGSLGLLADVAGRTSQDVRLTIYSQVSHMIAANPWQGSGYGTFPKSYLYHVAETNASGIEVGPPVANLHHPHNEVLLWFAEGGLLPVIGILSFALFVVIVCLRSSWRRGVALLALLTPFFIHSQVEYPFYHSAPHWIAFVALMAFACSEGYIASRSRYHVGNLKRLVPGLRVFVFAVAFGVSAVMMNGVFNNSALSRYEMSGGINLDALNAVSLPIVFKSRFDWHVHEAALGYSVYSGLETDFSAYERYLDWAKANAADFPRPVYYHQQLFALFMLGREEEYLDVFNEALFFFPDFRSNPLALAVRKPTMYHR